MRIIVCGGRDYDDADFVQSILDGVLKGCRGELTVMHGDATGADSLAHNWAIDQIKLGANIDVEPYPADWDAFGKAAGPMRNARMILKKPDLVIAFPGGRGTLHMKQLAMEYGVPLRCHRRA